MVMNTEPRSPTDYSIMENAQ